MCLKMVVTHVLLQQNSRTRALFTEFSHRFLITVCCLFKINVGSEGNMIS